MYLRYDFFGDETLINLPDAAPWKIFVQGMDENGYADCSLYLEVGGEKTLLKDAEDWLGGERKLTREDVGELHNEMVCRIGKLLAAEQPPRVIDLNMLESELLDEKYFELWKTNGRICPDEDGCW